MKTIAKRVCVVAITSFSVLAGCASESAVTEVSQEPDADALAKAKRTTYKLSNNSEIQLQSLGTSATRGVRYAATLKASTGVTRSASCDVSLTAQATATQWQLSCDVKNGLSLLLTRGSTGSDQSALSLTAILNVGERGPEAGFIKDFTKALPDPAGSVGNGSSLTALAGPFALSVAGVDGAALNDLNGFESALRGSIGASYAVLDHRAATQAIRRTCAGMILAIGVDGKTTVTAFDGINLGYAKRISSVTSTGSLKPASTLTTEIRATVATPF